VNAPYLSPAHVIVLLQRSDGRVLAVQHTDASATAPGQITVIGGTLKRDEFLDEGALRELAEKTGVRVAPAELEFCQLVHGQAPDGARIISVLFTAQRWQGEPRNTEPEEHRAMLWVDPGRPPSDCHPYTLQVLRNFTAGRLYGTMTAPAGGGAE
jgi:8-oxo-dGTP pyrophosphatase MutT (NUDIX family)